MLYTSDPEKMKIAVMHCVVCEFSQRMQLPCSAHVLHSEPYSNRVNRQGTG